MMTATSASSGTAALGAVTWRALSSGGIASPDFWFSPHKVPQVPSARQQPGGATQAPRCRLSCGGRHRRPAHRALQPEELAALRGEAGFVALVPAQEVDFCQPALLRVRDDRV